MIAAPADAGAAVIFTTPDGDITGGLTQTGRINRTLNPASTCAAPDPFESVVEDEDQFRFRNHTFSSSLTEPVCITVDVNSTSPCTALYSAAYLGAFDRLNPATHRAGDMGDDNGLDPYMLTVPAGSPFGVVVHETVPSGTCTAYSITVSSQGPWARSRPVAGGDPSIGSVLTGTDAVWAETPSVQRHWLRCDTAGANCADIPGATGPAYTVTDADLGHTIRFRNDATDAQGTNSSESDVVEPYIPFDSRAAESLGPGDRVHTGLFVRGAVEGRCGAPSSPGAILQPTASFLYDVFPVGSLLNEPVCLVVRTVPSCFGVTPTIYNPVFAPASGLTTNYVAHTGNSFGSVGVVSAILPAAESREVVVSHQQSVGTCGSYGLSLGADAPFATAVPVVTGTAAEGVPITASPGTWSGTPAFGFAWLRCDAGGAACEPIPGAAGASYTPAAADAGSRLRVRVTATQGRSVSSDSGLSEIVAPDPPEIVAPDPPLTGTVRLRSRNLAKAGKGGRVPVRVTCSEQCTAAVQLRVTRKVARRLKLGRRLVIARASGPVPAGRAVVLRAKLVKKARKALRKRKSVRFTIAATLTDSLGKTAQLSRKASMKRPKKRPASRPRRP